MGSYFGVSYEDIKSAIKDYKPQLNRSQLIRVRDFDVLMDAYNANPSSMSLALETFNSADYEKKMLILGGMLELGEYEKEEHDSLINSALLTNADDIWLVGDEFKSYAQNEKLQWFENMESCKEAFSQLQFASGLVLVKGSRKYQLEKIVN